MPGHTIPKGNPPRYWTKEQKSGSSRRFWAEKEKAAVSGVPGDEQIPESEVIADVVTNLDEESENPVEDVVTNPDVEASNDEPTAGLRTAPTPDSKKSEALAGEPPT